MAAQWPTRANMTLLVGCDSCGTSALAEALGDFRGAVLPSGDEGGPSYFSAEDRYTRGSAWYHSHYSLPSRAATLIDASRGMLIAPFAASRAHATLARPWNHKVVVVLRDPTALAWVLWRELSALPTSGASLGALLRPYLHPRNFSAKARPRRARSSAAWRMAVAVRAARILVAAAVAAAPRPQPPSRARAGSVVLPSDAAGQTAWLALVCMLLSFVRGGRPTHRAS